MGTTRIAHNFTGTTRELTTGGKGLKEFGVLNWNDLRNMGCKQRWLFQSVDLELSTWCDVQELLIGAGFIIMYVLSKNSQERHEN